MSLVRGLHSDAHMRPLRVVEVDYFLQGRLAFRPRGDTLFLSLMLFFVLKNVNFFQGKTTQRNISVLLTVCN